MSLSTSKFEMFSINESPRSNILILTFRSGKINIKKLVPPT